MSGSARRALALLYGAVSHGLFALAIAAMMANLWTGMTLGLGTLSGGSAWVANTLLALQFPIIHSLLLTTGGRRLLARLAPAGLGRDLCSTTYAASAAIQLLATFVLWSPTGVLLWNTSERALPFFAVLFGASWLLLVKALHDGGMGAQTGWIGWTAVFRGQRPEFGPLRTEGLFARCRQPIYLAFALTLWTGPGWTADHLMLAIIWSLYCWVAPLHKERRYERLFGEAFAVYRRRVPYIFPRLHR
jgi:protein-S-isoprenylcysteine O-methyltransferase Ste14